MVIHVANKTPSFVLHNGGGELKELGALCSGAPTGDFGTWEGDLVSYLCIFSIMTFSTVHRSLNRN